MKRALITGGAGFLGRHLQENLTARGDQFIVAGRKNIGEISDWKCWREFLRETKPDPIYHLLGTITAADEATLRAAHEEPTEALLQASFDLGLRSVPIFLLGSAAEYGDVPASRQPISEEEPARPVSAYGRSKLRATEIGLAFAERGLAVVAVRLFNVFGRGMSTQMMPGSVLSQLADHAPKIRTHALDRVRDFLRAEVAMAALAQLADTRIPGGTIVNLCSGQGLNLREIVAAMLAAAGRTDDLVVSEGDTERSTGVHTAVGDPSRLAQLLGSLPPAPSLDDFVRLLA